MNLAPALAWCAAALTATSAVAGAVDDLSIGYGGKACRSEGQAGGREVRITNASRSQAVVVTISVDADHRSYAYGDATGHSATFTYPYTEEHWLAPGASVILGCDSVRFSKDLTTQTFTLVKGAYQNAPPPLSEDPSRFVGAITLTRPARCIASNPGLYIFNRHPSRTIVAKVAMGGGEIGPMFIPPQGTGPWLGCRYDRAPGPVTILEVQFTNPAR